MWMQISAGRGPVECARAVWHLVHALETEMAASGGRVEAIDLLPEGKGALRSALLSVEGPSPKDFPAAGSGTVLWIWQSRDRPDHGRKNWFVDVSVLPDPVLPPVGDSRVRVETMRSGGPGGQNVNKVESGVRLVHLATGIVVVATEERSQLRNKALAFARLREKLDAISESDARSREEERWRRHDGIVRGEPFRTYEGDGFRLKAR